MPLRIPPSAQYQAPMFPLRGLWNHKPDEGDRLISVEIDWGVYPAGQAVQFQLSGNSPVAFSQIVALTVDNARCGSDVQFIFSDSGQILQIPAHTQGTFPVFTNGLSFYCVALNAGTTDVTCAVIHNSMPPPIQMLASSAQNSAVAAGLAVANGTTPIVPAPASGTLNGFSFDVIGGSTAQAAQFSLVDGAGHTLWSNVIQGPATNVSQPVGGINTRFFNGLSLVIGNNSLVGASVNLNVYFTVP
jgi:hypothetical protein